MTNISDFLFYKDNLYYLIPNEYFFNIFLKSFITKYNYQLYNIIPKPDYDNFLGFQFLIDGQLSLEFSISIMCDDYFISKKNFRKIKINNLCI